MCPDDRTHPHRLACEEYRRPGQVVLVTTRTTGPLPLTTPGVAVVLVQAMARVAAARGVEILAYCLMPDHLHVVVRAADDAGDVAGWVRFMKREASRRVGRPGMWQRSYWDRHARAQDDVATMVDYTPANPVRAGLCDVWHEWPYTWSRWHPQCLGPAPTVEGRKG